MEVEMEIEGLEWSEVKRPHFNKVLIGDFKTSMRIPPNFLKNLTNEKEEKINDPKTAIIEGPSGKIWHMKIEKRENGVYFTTGWQKFVQDHVLKEYEFLVFRYNGNLSFSLLLIFDMTCCEKDVSFSKEKVAEIIREEREDLETETEVLASQKEKAKQNNGCESKEKNKLDVDCVIISNCEERERKEKERNEREKEVEEVKFEEIRKFASDCKDLATKKRGSDFELKSFDKRNKFAKRESFCDLTKEIKKEIVDEFGNSSPDSNITTNKEGNNTSPQKKQKTFIIDEEAEEISKLANQERENEVNLVTRQERESGEGEKEKEVEELNYEKIRKFARDCENLATEKHGKNFELKSFSFEGKKKAAKEKFIDLTKEVKKESVHEFGNSSPDSNITTNKEGNKNNNNFPPKQKTSKFGNLSPDSNISTNKEGNKNKNNNTSKFDDEIEEITINEMPMHVRCNKRNFYGRVKTEENLKALESAMSFQSKFPSFVFHMTRNIERYNYVRFPAEFSRQYLPRKKAEFILHDTFNKKWDVSYKSYHNGDMLTRGWSCFKQRYALKEDDCCVFELIKPKEFKVHIFRSG